MTLNSIPSSMMYKTVPCVLLKQNGTEEERIFDDTNDCTAGNSFKTQDSRNASIWISGRNMCGASRHWLSVPRSMLVAFLRSKKIWTALFPNRIIYFRNRLSLLETSHSSHGMMDARLPVSGAKEEYLFLLRAKRESGDIS